MTGFYKELMVINPTLEELAASKIPDICLDRVSYKFSNHEGVVYVGSFFPNDYTGAYGTIKCVSSIKEIAEINRQIGLISEKIPELDFSSYGNYSGSMRNSYQIDFNIPDKRAEEVSFLSHEGLKRVFRPEPRYKNPYPLCQSGVSQAKLVDYLSLYCSLQLKVHIRFAAYFQIPESVYEQTGFAPSKLSWGEFIVNKKVI